MSATVYYRLSADASLDYRRNGRSQSSPPAFSSNEIPFPVSASCYSAKLNLDAIALASITVKQPSLAVFKIYASHSPANGIGADPIYCYWLSGRQAIIKWPVATGPG